jgi:mannose-6-phosphate isomerase-like protein (cupin superfamily)
MRTGSLVHDATAFNLHVHVLAADSPEVGELRAFRDRLRADPAMVSSYVATKKAIIAGGVTGSVDYAIRKGEFVSQALEGFARRPTVKGAKGMEKVNLREKLALFTDQWKPKVVGELNGQQVKLVKFHGPFVWHRHDGEDELFLVVKGRFRMEFRDRHVWVEEGESLIVPRGVEHRQVAEEEAHVMVLEPDSTLNTGNVTNERTVADLERIQ